MFAGNGVQRGLRYGFSCLVGVSEISAQSTATVYKPRGIKETALAQWVQVNHFICVRCSSIYATTEDITRHVYRTSFIVT